MDNQIICVQNLTKRYKLYENKQDRLKEVISLSHKCYHKDFCALNNISFDVIKGETVGIIGTNGSGKSTLLKIITGVLTPTEGKAEVHGKISALLELGTGFNQEYSGIDNIYLNGRMMGYSRKEMENKVAGIVEFADIGDFIYQPVKNYSSGMFARLAFAVAINVEPDILIVDEALSVGDLFFQNKCFKKFDELRSKGVTILFVSHDISSVRQMCSRVLWIEKGVQKIFTDSDTACDMYMDEKRKNLNNNVVLNDQGTGNNDIKGVSVNNTLTIPKIQYKDSKIVTEEFEILSCYFQDKHGYMTTHLETDTQISTHVFVKFNADMPHMIIGFVLENAKGLPIYDINNYINQQQGVSGKKGQILEIVYHYKLPRLMKGTYIVSTAIAQGTQDNHIMKTWLHGTNEVEIVNNGFNSSYIEIPSDIRVNYYQQDKIVLE